MRLFRLTLNSLVYPACLLMLWAVPVCHSQDHRLRAGVAKVDITPTDLTGLPNLFGHNFEGVHDHIFARALLLEDGVTKVAIVSTDLVEVGDTTPLREQIKVQFSIPVDHIMITATHDHSAPRAGSVTPGALAHPGNAATDAYTRLVYEKILDALKAAAESMQPARLGIDTGRADVNVNRDEYGPQGWKLGYNADRPSDKTVWVLKFETTSGEPLAILFNYAVHSTVAGVQNTLISGDLAGAAERYVETHYKNKIVALWTLGPAGDQAPKFSAAGGGSTKGEDVPVYDAMNAQGFMVGAEVIRVAERIKPTISAPRLTAAERIIPCPTKKGVNQMGDMKQQQVDSMNLHVGLITIDRIALGSVSGEVVTNIYWHLKRASPFTDTIMVTLTNDRVGYIADDAAYDTPIFEVNGSPLARGCAEDGIVHGIVDMIDHSLEP